MRGIKKQGEDGTAKTAVRRKQESEMRKKKGERSRGRELSATLLPVLVKCCVLSRRQPRMCQPSRLTLPNGLLNADIKLTRSFALPFSSLSLSLAPPSLSFSASAARSHYLSFSPCPSVCHSLVLCCSVYQTLAPFPPLFSCFLPLYSFWLLLQLLHHHPRNSRAGCLFSIYNFFYG